jgi:uncharacterized membrane-anchored protein
MVNQSTSNIKGVIVVVVLLVIIIAGYFIYKKLKESPEDKATKKDRKIIGDLTGFDPKDYAGMGGDYLSARAAAITASAKTFDIGDGKTYCTANGRVVRSDGNPCL